MTLVTIGTIRIHGSRQGEGFWLAGDGIKGWHDGVTYRRNLIARPQQHGYFDQAPYLDGRTVTLHGWCRARTLGQLQWYRTVLSGLAANGNLTKLAVADEDLTTYGYARVDAGIGWTTYRPALLAEWTSQFWLPNPRKYGDQHEYIDTKTGTGTSVGVTVSHRGTFPAAPKITVTGTMPSGYTLNGPGDRHYQVTRPLAAGETHLIDMEDGSLQVNGNVVYGGTADVDLWVIQPGDSTVTTFSGAGSATVTTRLRDTYI